MEELQEEVLEQEPVVEESEPQEEPVAIEPEIVIEEPEEDPFVPAPDGSLYAQVDENHKLILINQIDAFNQGLPAIEYDTSWDGFLYEKGYAPEKPEEEIKKDVRAIRDNYIRDIEWRVSRYRDQAEMQIETTDTEEEYHKILQYMQYLRDYPESSETWYEQNPMTFEEWYVEQD